MTGTVPNVGPLMPPGEPTVLMSGMPAAVISDQANAGTTDLVVG